MEPTLTQPPQWAPPAPPAPPAPKKERQWLIPTIGLAVVLVLAAGVGITIAATGDSATAATVPGGCSGVAPGNNFICDNGKWVYYTPGSGTTHTTTTTDFDTGKEFARGLIESVWATHGVDMCQSMNELIATGVPRSTTIQMAMDAFNSYDGAYHDEVLDALRAKVESC